MNMNSNDILNKYRSASFSERDKGTRFERLMRAYLFADLKSTTIDKPDEDTFLSTSGRTLLVVVGDCRER